MEQDRGGEAKASTAVAAAAAVVLPAPLPCDKDLDNGSDDPALPASSAPSVWERGLVVLTPYGWGTVRSYRESKTEDGMLEVRLEWNAICYIRPTDILDRYVFIRAWRVFGASN